MINQSYFNGDFWQCVEETAQGESPTSAPNKWRRIRIPAEFRQVLKKLTYANLLELDGQTDKAALHRSAGEALLDDLVRENANHEHGRHNGSVHGLQGQSVKASVILDDAYGLMRWDPDDLEDSEKQDGRRSISAALQQVWDAWWWETLMVIEQSALRDTYAQDEFYLAGTEIYLPLDGKYYLAVQPNIFIPPAETVNGSTTANTGFWAEGKACYSGSDVDNTQAYAWGTVVRNPVNGQYYQRGGSISVSDLNASEGNGTYKVATDFHDHFPAWTLANQPTTLAGNYFRAITGSPWFLLVQDNSQVEVAVYQQTDATTPNSPDQVQGWQVFPGHAGDLPGPTITANFVAPAPPDTGSWGLLTPFDPVLTIARKVRSVNKQHPINSRNPEPYHFHQMEGGVRVPHWTCGTAWVWSRRVTPILTGDEFDEETTYEATPASEIVFDE